MYRRCSQGGTFFEGLSAVGESIDERESRIFEEGLDDEALIVLKKGSFGRMHVTLALCLILLTIT